ncbi:MAG: hypothetical protein HRT57_15730 [Crocinitomicaceae bacterium]|nr:hypothetical protein [Crocinitomicaceae bacterium]
MKKSAAIIFGLSLLMISSCKDDPVTPPPVPTVDLNCNFSGEINGAEFVLTENVLGYTHSSTKEQIIAVFPDFSTAAYFSKMSSPTLLTAVKIGLGSISWNANTAPSPTLTVFNDFMNTNTNPVYSDSAEAGFEFIYTDASDREWRSSQASLNFQEVEFTITNQGSDASGDYSSFTCNFDCYAYSLNPDSLAILPIPVYHIDSISATNVVYSGWFER